MVKFSFILLSALFLLVGCWNAVKQEVGKTETTKASSPFKLPKAKSEQQFLLKGASFSISQKGLIYFVDLSDPSIVIKADLKSPDLTSHFIDLKEWLKWEEGTDLIIDDLWVDFEGRLILAESTTGKILRISKDARKLENLADSYDGYRMAKIDGLRGNQNGDIYVGSPHTATLYKINSSQGRLSILNDDLVRSNDIVIDDTGARLVVAESQPNRLAVYDLNSSNETIIGWNLVTFPDNSPPPTSLDFIDHKCRYLAVLSGNGTTIQIFDLLTGKIRSKLPIAESMRIRCYDDWFYLQSERGIYRKKIPGNFQ
jgi:WD40 repeat protein